MKIQMPKACISCNHYTGTGFANDDLSPVRDMDSGARVSRCQYGTCSAHCKDVFCTELCGSYEADDLIEVVDVANRAAPLQPHQEMLAI